MPQPIELPVCLDDSKIVLLFSKDDWIVFSSCFAFGIIFHQLGWSLLLGIAMTYVAGRYRNTVPNGHLIHLMYWKVGLYLPGSNFINPFVRRFRG